MKKKFYLSIILAVVLAVVVCYAAACGQVISGGERNEGKTVKVTLEPNGGTGVSELTLIGKSGSAMTLPTPVREGYRFDQWYDGYEPVDQTVFPQSDVTLIARYYALQDTHKSTNCATDMNKEYESSDMTSELLLFKAHAFDKNKIEYLRHNNVEISFSAEMETYLSTIRIVQSSAEGTLTFTGASKLDKIATQKVYYTEGWQLCEITANFGSRFLIGEDAYILRLLCNCTPGSTYVRIRNVKIRLEYVEKAGTLV